jgi:Zn-dependent protease with chaperone function/uncharacterized tellurite resistance protein B-like protein
MVSMTTFFEHQHQAKRKTSRLLLLFGLTTIAILLAVHTALSLFLYPHFVNLEGAEFLSTEAAWKLFLDPELLGITSLGVILIIGGGSLLKIAQLQSGGDTVALSLGGELIPPSTPEPKLRQLVNVVEEMAIASGAPVPPVYLIPEDSINAFAAGNSIHDAVIGVNSGTLRVLTRDELQGVIAHEFSHILNGDMRLNIRLIGVLQGLLVIAIIGRMLFRISTPRRRHYSSNRRSNGGGAIILLGLALLVIGWIGVLGGRLIKAAVSRQREFLADASAVQFSRNPDGIAGALKKIGGYIFGSEMKHPKAEEASHLFFGNGLGTSWFSLFATHPPLTERIQRIDPHFQGHYEVIESDFETSVGATTGLAAVTSSFAEKDVRSQHTLSPDPTETPPQPRAVETIGTPSPQHLSYAQELLSSMPLKLKQDIHTLPGAQAAIFVLLTSADEEVALAQRQELQELQGTEFFSLYESLLEYLPPSTAQTRSLALPIVDMSLASLSIMDAPQRQQFLQITRKFALADGEISLFEFVLHKVFTHHFKMKKGWKEPKPLSESAFTRSAHELLSVAWNLSSHHKDEKSDGRPNFSKLTSAIPNLPEPIDVRGKQLVIMDGALEKLEGSSTHQREAFLHALESILLCDDKVTRTEAELFRGIAAALECPVPPILGMESSNAASSPLR